MHPRDEESKEDFFVCAHVHAQHVTRAEHATQMFDVSDAWGDEPTAPATTAPETAAAADTGDLEALLQRVELQGAPPPVAKKVGPPRQPKAAAASSATGPPPVELGYTYYDPTPALAEHFPSKIGGAPVWLLPECLPPASALTCGRCGRRRRFLMQLYCPRPEVEHAYHRSLMVFCCGGACLQHATGWAAFRCNLPKAAPCYVEHEDGSWTARGREALSTATAASLPPPAAAPLPELYIWVELEGDWQAVVAASDAASVAQTSRLLSAYEAVEGASWAEGGAEAPTRPHTARGDERASVSSAADGSEMDDDDEEEVESGLYGFQRRASAHPMQALRYNRDPRGMPMWAGSRGRPPAGMPPACERCGAPRTFECQLMPQLVCALEEAAAWRDEEEEPTAEARMEGAAAENVAADGAPAPKTRPPPAVDALRAVAGGGDDADALDWGVLAVYSCSASCAMRDGECGYATEWCWHQPLA